MYLLAIGLPDPGNSDNDSELLTDALAAIIHDSSRRNVEVAYIEDTPANAAIILADAPFPVLTHSNGERIEITQDRIIGIVASSKAYKNTDGVMSVLKKDGIDPRFRWVIEQAALKPIS